MKLKPGSYCVPRDEREWKAMMDLFISLGVGTMDKRKYEHNSSIVYDDQGRVRPLFDGPCRDGQHYTEVCDFIVGVYELAAEKKPENKCRLTDLCGDGELVPGIQNRLRDVRLADHEKRIKVVEDMVDGSDMTLGTVAGRLKRLEAQVFENGNESYISKWDIRELASSLKKLEKALNEHLVEEKHRCDRTDEDMIAEILEHFDFARCRKAMIALDWGWFFGGTPTLLHMKDEAQRLLGNMNDDPDLISTASGGFHVERDRSGYLRLSFRVQDWNTNPH